MSELVDGWEAAFDGIQFRIGKGEKSADDLVLQWLTPGGWRTLRFEAVFYMAQFFFENEDRLYPAAHQLGGRKFLGAISTAALRGADEAWQTVLREKATSPRRVA